MEDWTQGSWNGLDLWNFHTLSLFIIFIQIQREVLKFLPHLYDKRLYFPKTAARGEVGECSRGAGEGVDEADFVVALVSHYHGARA